MDEINLEVKELDKGGFVLSVNGELIAAGSRGVVAAAAGAFLRETLPKKEKVAVN